MWMCDVSTLCRQHLLGEHGELHKFRHMFVEKRDMHTRMKRNQIFPMLMKQRHDELVEELLRRGYNHNSPYEQPDVAYLYENGGT
jgi:uncharacterized membrane protein YheB (UPF0754 family)